MKKLFTVFICVLLAAALAACGGSTPAEPTSEDYTLATEYLENKQYAEAVEAFGKVIAAEQNAFAYIGRGDAYTGLEDAQSALADYTRAIELGGGAAAYLGAVDANIRLNEFEKALALAEQGVKKYSTDELRQKLEQLKTGNVSDSAGRIRKEAGYDADDKLLWYHIIEYGQDGLSSRRTSYDESGSQTAVYPDIWDANGNLAETSWFFSSDGIYMRRVCLYNAQNLVTEMTGYGNDAVATNRAYYTYDTNGRRVQTVYYPNIESATYRLTLYEWNDFGKLSGYKTYLNGTEYEGRTTYEYNELQQNVRTNYYDASDKPDYYFLYEYNADGEQTVAYRYSADGQLQSETRY